MEKPYRFFAIHNETKETIEFDHAGFAPRAVTKETEVKGVFTEVEMWTVYEDTRYKARLRLYNYVTYTKQGLEPPRYRPYANTQIGISIPILG